MEKLSDRILREIKEKKVAPKPKMFFLLKNYSVWALFVLSIIVGGIAFLIILFNLINSDWDVYKYLGSGYFQYIFLIMPYFWLVILGLFLFVAYYNYRHTKKGYQYKVYKVFLLSVVLSLVLGAGLFVFGLGEEAEQEAVKFVPHYQTLTGHRMRAWHHPEQGLLAGKIIKLENDHLFDLEDCQGVVWLVDTSEVEKEHLIKSVPKIRVKIIGEKKGETQFKAEEIRPWVKAHANHNKKMMQQHMGKKEWNNHQEDGGEKEADHCEHKQDGEHCHKESEAHKNN